MSEKNLIKLEHMIRGKMSAIKLKTLKPVDSGIEKLFKAMKESDEALHDSLLAEYKVISEKLKSDGLR